MLRVIARVDNDFVYLKGKLVQKIMTNMVTMLLWKIYIYIYFFFLREFNNKAKKGVKVQYFIDF